jgi:diguanylate cyclase (GGDEF)-like protein
MDGTVKNSILIVDDEKMNLQVLVHILSGEYTIYTAKDGQSAIEKAKQLMPDLILLDIIMPEMDGYEVLTALKATEETREIPVIFITGLSSAEDEEKGLNYDAADYISKPFSPMIVNLRVRNQIRSVNQLRLIERLSMLDQLTGIPNRRSFDSRLNAEWRRAAASNSPISMLMGDVDKFKTYNDTYGHLQGDVVLQTVARTLTETLTRPLDFAARWGGEEFVALLPNTDMDAAMNIAEQIRLNVEHVLIPLEDGSSTNVTISLGVHTIIPVTGTSLDAFISQADAALYTAKEHGRNRVCTTRTW